MSLDNDLELSKRELREIAESYVDREIPADSMEKLEKIVGRGITRRDFISNI